MPEINLLQGNVRTSSTGLATRVILNLVGACLLVAVLIVGGIFYAEVKSARAQDTKVVAQQSSALQSISGDKNYKNFIASQSALTEVTQLFTSHLGWTSMIPNFANATLKGASFNSFDAAADGGVNITGTVPNFNDLDEMMQGFQLPAFNSFIQSVSLQNVGLDHSDIGNSVAFTVHVQFNPATLKYQSQ
jgi:hypothetical protein